MLVDPRSVGRDQSVQGMFQTSSSSSAIHCSTQGSRGLAACSSGVFAFAGRCGSTKEGAGVGGSVRREGRSGVMLD